MASIYAFSDYKDFLRHQIEESGSWGLISRLAEAAQCQRSYLSRVLNSEVHLTSDHIYRLSKHWELSERETEYFLVLLEKEKAASDGLRSYFDNKLRQLRAEHENLERRVKRPRADLTAKEITYYSAWYFSALHILVSIPQYQTTKAIAAKLQLDINLVEDALKTLNEYGLIKHERGRWQFNSSEVHVTRDSPLACLHHSNWRARAVQNSQKRDHDAVHFTVVQSIDQQAWNKIKSRVLGLIDEATAIAGPSKEEKLICLACDFFEV